MFEERIKKLQKIIVQKKLEALLVSNSVNIGYLTGYFNFSLFEREAYLFITPISATLFTDSRYIEAVEKIVSKKIKKTTEEWKKVLKKEVDEKKIKNIGFEKNLTYDEYKSFRKVLNIKLTSTDYPVEELRSQKDADEIKKMKKAAKLTDNTYSYILKHLKIGVSEKEIAYKMGLSIKENGGTLSFDTIVAFGANSSVPHHITSSKRLSKNDSFILLDFGAKVDGYCCDMTRTIVFNQTSKAEKIYQAVLDSQTAAIKYLNSQRKTIEGKKASKVANNTLAKYGFPKIPHGLGHGIGLEVHEVPHLSPKADDILIANQVFSVEPGIYIPGFGGVRIEDTVFFNGDSVEIFTNSPK